MTTFASYSAKCSQVPYIHIAGNFLGIQFSQIDDHYCYFVGLIFVDVSTHARYALYNQAYFAGVSFVVGGIICKNCENWTPQKFPAIQYIITGGACIGL